MEILEWNASGRLTKEGIKKGWMDYLGRSLAIMIEVKIMNRLIEKKDGRIARIMD
jgi:hypothetical protein